jgi:deoxyribodipyrimidine photolyase-related protein
MRGVYWAHMPGYAEKNFFEHDRPLPGWFWTGDTGMRCLQHAITQTLDHAYAHHIQRLMVTGNFALLAGIDPDDVDGWYLGVYIDAIEWVEITNTRGMSQFADGGIVGTKPYVSSANYMHKMGPHCAACRYNRQGKTEDDACPFNSLYWHFHARNRHLLEKNPRIGMVYRTWDKMDPAKQQALLDRGDAVLHNLEQL